MPLPPVPMIPTLELPAVNGNHTGSVGVCGLGLEILDADTNGGQAAEAKEFPSRQIIERF